MARTVEIGSLVAPGGRPVTRTIVVAIDGPAGAGKSTVGERLAERLGYFFFDTGVLYRVVALRALELGISAADEQGLDQLVGQLDIRLTSTRSERGRQYDVLVDGREVSAQIRAPAVDAAVSAISASPSVRAGLIEPQRRQVQGAGTVVAGRDIGTVVCPDADLKVFLLASPEERARRRLRQVGGDEEELSEVLAAIRRRDALDSTRSLAPLAKAEDAVELATDGLSIDEVVSIIERLLRERLLGAQLDCAH
jgi:cytidylate kinase